MKFKENLKNELDFQGITTKELSYKAGISIHTLNSYLSGHESIPAADVAVRIARALDVSVEYLITGIEPKLPKDYTLFLKYRKLLRAMDKIPHEVFYPLQAAINCAAEIAKHI